MNTIQDAVAEITSWARHAQSYRQWFVEACPSEDGKKLVVFYRPDWIDKSELDLHAHSTFMLFPVVMKPTVKEVTRGPGSGPSAVSPAPRLTAHDLKCPGCGHPCVKCHGKL